MRYSLCKTTTPRGVRYYANSRRVSKETYHDIKNAGTLDTFFGGIKGRNGAVHDYCESNVSASMRKTFNLP